LQVVKNLKSNKASGYDDIDFNPHHWYTAAPFA
jgi:hypothetical protein